MIKRCGRLGVFFFLTFMGLGLLPAAQDPGQSAREVTFAIDPVPSWVKPIQSAADIPPGEENSGTVYLLVDRQENLEQNAFYYHEVQEITSENGVQNGASISVSFDPAFEKLTFHSIQLIRGGAASNRLDRARIRLSPTAKDADRLIYDSSYSADMALDDVRVGDLIEYSYTREGANPLKQGKYSATYPMQWSFPIMRNALRLIYSAHRKIHFRAQNGASEPTFRTADGMTELSYEASNVPGRVVDNDVPEDYSPRQRLEISEASFHRWRNQYGGMKAEEARRLKELEQENARLKKLVADLSLDKQILEEVLKGK